MNNLDMKFFDTYKRLDKIMQDIFSCNNGVSAYIEEMEKFDYIGKTIVSCWKDDYYTLKHLRWLRNKIAHEADDNNSFCKNEDLKELNDFYKRILNGTDALAIYYRNMQTNNNKKSQNKSNKKVQNKNNTNVHYENTTKNKKPKRKKKSRKILTFILILCIFIVFFSCAFVFTNIDELNNLAIDIYNYLSIFLN